MSVHSGNYMDFGPPRVVIRQRKQSGNPAGKRGLIVSTDAVSVETRGANTIYSQPSIGLNPQGLRFALLFWDELAFPALQTYGPRHGNDEQFLIDAGVMFRPVYSGTGEQARLLLESHPATFNYLESIEPGVWAIADGDLAFFSRTGLSAQKGGCGLELFRAIPVPNIDVPLPEILAFKVQRQPELLRLRYQIDTYMDELSSKENIQDALADYVTKVDQACCDVLKVFSEWRQPFRFSDWKVSVDARPFVPIMAAIGAFEAAQAMQLSMLHSLATGLTTGAYKAAPFLKVASNEIGWRGLRDRHTPFRYVKSYHQEVFGR